MSTLGLVKKAGNMYIGELKTLKVKLPISINPVTEKSSDEAPDFRVTGPNGVEVGAGWTKTGEQSGTEYVSLKLSHPELWDKPIYANLGKAAGQDDENVFAIIWNAPK